MSGESPLTPMQGRTCLITGANSGIGKATAMVLACMGARIVMVCRDRERGESARAEIASTSGNARIQVLVADLSAQDAVRRLASDVRQLCPELHVLVNNAGVYLGQRSSSVDGLEMTFAVNHLAYFLLTNLLLDLLRASAPARIINVSSGAHARAQIKLDDLQATEGYSGWRAYGQSKLANVLFTYELARRLGGSGVTVNAVHPGVVATNFGRSTGLLRFGMRAAGRFMLSPQEGARAIVYLASAADVEAVTGKYFAKGREVRSSPASRNETVQRRLWQISEELTGSSG